jgi:hypothetical protein
VDRATDYHIWINRNNKTYQDKWVKGTSYKVNDKGLPGGEYKWWVQSYNADGYGPWTGEMVFEIPTKVPAKVDIVSPFGVHNGASVVYQWNTDGIATWYQLIIHKDGKPYHKPHWFNTGITNGIVSEEIDHANFGKYEWWMQGWSPDGYGKWSDKGVFSYGLSVPVAPAGIIPTGGSHVFNWTGADDIPWYQLWIHKDDKYYKDIWVQSTNWVFASRLPYGDYGFWVRPWKDKEFGPWSDAGGFKIGASIPVAPTGTIFSPPTSLRWDDSASRDAKWYQIVVHWGKNPFLDEWVKVEDTIDYGGSVRGITNLPAFVPPFGTYTTWIRAWTDDNMGPWSEGLPFTVQHR